LLLIFGDLSVPEEMTRIRECLSLRRLELYSVDGNGLYDLFVGTHLPFLGTHCSWLSSMTLNPCEKKRSITLHDSGHSDMPAISPYFHARRPEQQHSRRRNPDVLFMPTAPAYAGHNGEKRG
jgi:hypothetical protein